MKVPGTATCPVTHKFGFASRKIARRHLKSWAGRGDAAFTGKSIYRCPHSQCGLWHITSQTQKRTA